MTQFYLPTLKEDSEYLTINSSEFYHIVKSRRAKVGDTIKIFNGRGMTAEAEIKEIYKDKISLKIKQRNFFTQKYKVCACLAIIKIDRFELALEKLTEVGITDIIPIFTERVNVGLDSFTKRYERFQKILIEASKQSHRGFLPLLHSVKKLEDIFEKNEESLNIVLDKDSNHRIFFINEKIKSSEDIKIFIGPEGGFSSKEIEFLKQQKNIYFVKISENILRSETAAIVASSIVFQIKNC
ncbi:MAG: RsmE family RNA methyltransferase [Elusimicrobiota bacterium]|nr:16S rRNA (uracil(1498)-N(3))-methyltransferase [Endomicrobiia bacterium]MDW8166081.1 RsmE family RNA methyltransferase [Elusimicrobiota bacterium]